MHNAHVSSGSFILLLASLCPKFVENKAFQILFHSLSVCICYDIVLKLMLKMKFVQEIRKAFLHKMGKCIDGWHNVWKKIKERKSYGMLTNKNTHILLYALSHT